MSVWSVPASHYMYASAASPPTIVGQSQDELETKVDNRFQGRGEPSK